MSQVQVLITPPNRPLGFSCGLFSYKQANYHKSEVRKLVHGTNYYSSGWRLKGLTHNPKENEIAVSVFAESGITRRTKRCNVAEVKRGKRRAIGRRPRRVGNVTLHN